MIKRRLMRMAGVNMDKFDELVKLYRSAGGKYYKDAWSCARDEDVRDWASSHEGDHEKWANEQLGGDLSKYAYIVTDLYIDTEHPENTSVYKFTDRPSDEQIIREVMHGDEELIDEFSSSGESLEEFLKECELVGSTGEEFMDRMRELDEEAAENDEWDYLAKDYMYEVHGVDMLRDEDSIIVLPLNEDDRQAIVCRSKEDAFNAMVDELKADGCEDDLKEIGIE